MVVVWKRSTFDSFNLKSYSHYFNSCLKYWVFANIVKLKCFITLFDILDIKILLWVLLS